MLRLSILLSLFLAATGFADRLHDLYGIATHTANAEVKHEGDYVVFEIGVAASCYQTQNEARSRVIENVNALVQWLGEVRTLYAGTINYNVGLIQISRRGYAYGPDESNCINTYEAGQNVTLTLNRDEAAAHLDSEIVQGLFNDLQIIVSTLNSANEPEVDSYEITTINSVRKGLWEESLEALRIEAKAKALNQATRDFLAFLGDTYQGWWRLHAVDFSNRYYAGSSALFLPPSAPSSGRVDDEPVLSILKLEPITLEVEGNFVFHFQTRENYLP